MTLREQISSNNLPQHIAIIMDGNGRWAQKAGEKRAFGHQHGVDSVRNAVEGCRELGIGYLTLYAFSTENWNRPKEEVEALMALLVQSILNEEKTLKENDIRLNVIGDTTLLPQDCKNTLMEVIESTSNNQSMTLTLALSYSGRWDITNAMKSIGSKIASGELNENDITESLIQDHLSTAGIPDPELMIRTSGEFRISNFLLWQLAYSEIFITDVLWPDFEKDNLHEAILNFQSRERRFGLTGEQIKKEEN